VLLPTGLKARAMFGVALVAATLAAAAVQGALPGLIYVEHIQYFNEGSIRCMHDLGLHALTSRCHAFGEPVGFPLLTGGPLIALGTALMYLPGVGSLGAVGGALVLFDALGIVGGAALMRRLGAGPWVALGVATAWTISPSVVSLGSYGGTLVGYVLLPAYAYLDLVVMDALADRRGRRLSLLLAGYALARVAALFLDGYSFVTSALVGACLWTAWLLARDRTAGQRVRGAAVFGLANLLALALYLAYVPFDFPDEPIEIFRALGLDPVTLALPSQSIWWASKFGLAVDHSARLWGDPSAVQWNYVGYVGLGLAVWCLVRRRRDPLVLALTVAALVAFVLSLGPAFKLDAPRRSDAVRYTMPKGEFPELPWAPLFEGVPGVESMRATYRWFGVTRMVLILLAGLAIAELARGPGRARTAVALLLAGIAVVEVLPTVPLYLRIYRDRYEDRVQIREQLVEDLDRATNEGERAFVLSDNGAHNDFVVNYLASATGLRTYNAGGDKNAYYARSAWPPEIRQLAPGQVPPGAVERALRSGKVDVVVAPFFSLQSASDFWPPLPAMEAQARAAFAPILAAPRLKVARYRWFATVRLEKSPRLSAAASSHRRRRG
jgi:hypothetical protein